ncbi:MAG: hypothetical protein P857_744 [Candidatus Xenolissoclinum pacificiensis L6]|uniref:CD-NTase-associated protein 12/Pycsar effector protein TIR domain-containing protein n=1 Tax=Candidatus Xenolissoclinum pacificiensis L6 TaxID=1401685 RepID=W2UZI1_9RICK|nr:MAG: hypothetical protein P857_744 [Candidatus Xenolissoclinum pacificiensis L6]
MIQDTNNVGEEHKSPRARQNVILELGMLLLTKFGRERVIIIKESSVERPSDIEVG